MPSKVFFIKHLRTGHVFSVRANSFISACRCLGLNYRWCKEFNSQLEIFFPSPGFRQRKELPNNVDDC